MNVARNKVKTMSEEIKTQTQTPDENLPAFVKAAPELLPVWDWWVKEGKSTLMMLVSALAGRDHIMNAYAEAVKERYRFFSFGDAMFIQ